MHKKYGIISGYGTLAGIIFQQHLHTLTQTRLRPQTDADFPNYMILNFPRNVLTNTGHIADTQNVELMLAEAANILQPHTIHTMILCNTLHEYDAQISQHLPNNINLVELVSTECAAYVNPLILTSEGINPHTSKYAQNNPHATLLAVPELIESVIKNADTADTETEKGIQNLFQQHPNHDAYVLGCTELPALRELFETHKPANSSIVDCLEVAANHIITLEETQ